MVNLSTNIFNEINESLPFTITDLSGERIRIKAINFEGTEISEVTDTSDNIFNKDQFIISAPLLNIPGIGYISPGTRVIYRKTRNVLLYGWHTNCSNQTIYTWYLEPLDSDTPPKTLYKDMINEINLFEF